MKKATAPRSRSAYREKLSERMRRAREAADYSQSEIAHLLSVSRDAYQKMEQRGSLPADLIEPFAALTGTDPWYVLTGRKDRPVPDNTSKIRRIS